MRMSSVGVELQSGTSRAGAPGAAALAVDATAVPDRRIAWSGMTDSLIAEAVADFESVRHRLFGIAYQMLGRATDAEDVVQDVWIRWQGADRARVRDPVAFLVTVTKRVAINAVTSARVRREVSVGVGLRERDYAAADPAVEAERGEELELAVHFLIARLSPVERAVYVLREAFGYSFRDIADVLELSEANARQLARRARIRLAGQQDNPVDPAYRNGLLEALLHAARAGEMARLIETLTNAVVPAHSGRIGGDSGLPGDRLSGRPPDVRGLGPTTRRATSRG